jgi:replication factor A1
MDAAPPGLTTISALQPKQANVNVSGIVVEKSPVREFQKFGKPGRVCNAQLKDSTGTIVLSLWNEDVDRVNIGDKVVIKNGYVSEWQGEKQLGAGRFGTIEKQ